MGAWACRMNGAFCYCIVGSKRTLPRIFIPPLGWQATGGGRHYPYGADLLALDACRPRRPVENPPLKQVATVLNVDAWSHAFSGHPDDDFRAYIISGLAHGFRIGFDRTRTLHPAGRNMPSADAHPSVVQSYIDGQKREGHIIGPLSIANVHVNRIGVIPKGHTPGKWRLITDLSHP